MSSLPLSGADTTPAARIEHGWQRLADGLHVQRYFLHVHPRRCAEVSARLAEVDAEPLFATFPAAALLLGPMRGEPVFRADRLVCHRLPWRAVALVGTTTASQRGRLDAAAELLVAAELTWYAALASDVLIHDAALARAERSAPVRDGDGWAALDLDGSPVRIAAQWLTAAAAQLWDWFARERTSTRTRSYVSWLDGRDLDPVRFARELFVEASLERLRVGLESAGRAAPDEPWPDRGLFTNADPIMDQLLDDLDDLVLQDLLQTNVPHPRQFQKYWAGGGAGQSE